MNNWPRQALNAVVLTLLLSGSAFAQLAAVDPGPYTFATGKYPMWYQEIAPESDPDIDPPLPALTPPSPLSLELCQSRAVSSRVRPLSPTAYMCTLLPEPGVFDDTQPMVFPDNWPPEAFWFLAETSIDDVAGLGLEVYVAGIEAAFASENPVDGDQQSFARIRIRVNVPSPGTYVITHPYGVETVSVNTSGRKAINITRDIGIGAPGNFTGVLNGEIGPFLRSINGPYYEENPDTGVMETYIGDPNLTEQVTGSPNGTNLVRIRGPVDPVSLEDTEDTQTIETNLFTLSGKVFDDRAQTLVEINRATYRRTTSGTGTSTQVEVFGKADSSSTLCFRESVALEPDNPPSPCLVDMLGDGNSKFYASHLLTGNVPPVVVVTASNPTGTTRPTAVSSKLSDVVKIQKAQYNWSDHSLLIEARSSDEVVVPDMVAQGYGRLLKSGTLQNLTVAALNQPPATVTIKSAAGGSDTEPVIVVGKAPVIGENQAPIAVADNGSTSRGVPITLNLLANDSDSDGNEPLYIAELGLPTDLLGTVELSGTTAVVYTPPVPSTADNLPLTTTFTYKAKDVKGMTSQWATVAIAVAANQPPTAVNDAVTTLGVAIPITVLANDTDLEGNRPLTVASVTPPPVGTVTVSSDNTVLTYTPPTTVTTAFSTTFTYVAQDSFGALSQPATVTVQVSPTPVVENFAVTTAQVAVRSNNRFTWDFAGTSSVTTGNLITIQATTQTGLVTLGATTVPGNGRWKLKVSNSTVIPASNPTYTIRSSLGIKVSGAAVTIIPK